MIDQERMEVCGLTQMHQTIFERRRPLRPQRPSQRRWLFFCSFAPYTFCVFEKAEMSESIGIHYLFGVVFALYTYYLYILVQNKFQKIEKSV